MRFQVSQVMDAIELRLTTDIAGAQAVVDLGQVIRWVELDGGRPVNLVRVGMAVDALGRYLVDGGAILYGVVERSLLSESELTSKERMVLSRWADDGLVEVTSPVGDRVAEVADLTGLPMLVLGEDRGPEADLADLADLVKRYGWADGGAGRMLRLLPSGGSAVLRPVDPGISPTAVPVGADGPVIGRAPVRRPSQPTVPARPPEAGTPGDAGPPSETADPDAATQPDPAPAAGSDTGAGSDTAPTAATAPAPETTAAGTDPDPAASDPAASDPAASDPAASDPAASDPAAAASVPTGREATPAEAAGSEAANSEAPNSEAAGSEATVSDTAGVAAAAPSTSTPEAPVAEQPAGSTTAPEAVPADSPTGELPLPVQVFTGRDSRNSRLRVSRHRFRRLEPNGARSSLLERRWQCAGFECPAFGELRRGGQPVPRLQDGVPVCPRHGEPVTDAGPRPPAYPVSIVVDDLPRRRLVVRSGEPVQVGSADNDPDVVSVARWLHRAAANWISPVHVRLEAGPEGLTATDVSGNGTVVWQRTGPDHPGTTRTLRRESYQLGEWDSVELYTGIELAHGDRRPVTLLGWQPPASVLVDAPTAAHRQLSPENGRSR